MAPGEADIRNCFDLNVLNTQALANPGPLVHLGGGGLSPHLAPVSGCIFWLRWLVSQPWLGILCIVVVVVPEMCFAALFIINVCLSSVVTSDLSS